MRTAPPVSMLWGPVDPADALTTRFGFTDAGHAASWLGDVLQDSWALDAPMRPPGHQWAHRHGRGPATPTP